MLKNWINYFEKELRGPFVESKEVNAVGWNCVERDALYSTKEKKELRPNQACMNMNAKSNRDAEKAVQYCSGLGGRVLVPVDVTADSLPDATLKQVSHRKNIYKAFQLHKQICYFIAKYPETFSNSQRVSGRRWIIWKFHTEFLSWAFTPYLRCGVCCDNEDVECDH